MVKIYQNFSVVTNVTKDWNASIQNCTKALEIDSQSAKAYYIRSIAQCELGHFSNAINDAKQAIKISPNDKSLRDNYEKIKKRKANIEDEEKNRARKMLQGNQEDGLYEDKDTVAKFVMPDFN
mmetsp:Transcript_101751/g.140630  ORF Transcript_101751/g.140630 Transcript_101751/m.140630 type:complete len:123 (-) Transcript_101751:34-402(-)|eukprot:CAMPEP_0176375824 /NCGR_PEP_ID=MMETSP0126-20121128/27764_1 /TAXON_ID=141414 ORGANISM="Strombidinopsis acuminatum, Strain SPMC142" /NCGR_SAMPLE_ID=MMETSP0126 /ASSEMBLY_ACC=CAM_ASM_000229 /LENGTH=122 /DNA_ID=CAMNT_0017737027 /DNA_START=556 /DNA_END=924 /DNA_ORIENTATION=-